MTHPNCLAPFRALGMLSALAVWASVPAASASTFAPDTDFLAPSVDPGLEDATIYCCEMKGPDLVCEPVDNFSQCAKLVAVCDEEGYCTWADEDRRRTWASSFLSPTRDPERATIQCCKENDNTGKSTCEVVESFAECFDITIVCGDDNDCTVVDNPWD